MNKPFESNLIKWRPEPLHIAIIMDGNGRWASRRGLPVPAGHRAGVEAVRAALKTCKKKGIEVLTLFAFSSENWGRPETEVRALMALLCHYLRREVEQLQRDHVRLRFIGRRDRLSGRLQRLMARSEEATAANTGATLVLAVDYGGQWDVIDAVKKLASEVAAGTLSADQINPDRFKQTLSLGDLPAPDLCIRTGGDARISNFMLWQLAYTEFYFCDALWPDFDEAALTRAIEDFQSRERRFGLRSGSDIFSESLDKTGSS
ncbi:MAG: polyprenyl diphosphate synthase [Luminiphilus sp.]|nr:polyprenyl diphosphate synthase [Luminiphilus sp.]